MKQIHPKANIEEVIFALALETERPVTTVFIEMQDAMRHFRAEELVDFYNEHRVYAGGEE